MSRYFLIAWGWALALLPAACHSQDSADEERGRGVESSRNWASKLADAQPKAAADLEVYAFSFSNKANENARSTELMRSCKQQAVSILSFCGIDRPPKLSLPVKMYASVEEKGLALENTQPVQIRWQEPSLALVSSPYFGEAQLGIQNALLLRQLLGKPATLALEDGLSIYFNPQWQFKGHQHWAGRLLYKNNLPPLKEILDTERRQSASPLVYRAAAASFTQYLLEQWGRAAFLKRYADWIPEPAERSTLERGWHRWLQPHAKAPPPQARPLPYLKGFNFAHEGYSIFNGYGSGYAAEALEKQKRLGANVVAIVPYSYMRNPRQPSSFPIMRRAGTETDEGVIRDALLAQELGMKVVLKPQIWLGGGHWPGDIEMRTEADWAAFFQHYYRWIRHYALLAEIYGMDMLCVGVEFAKATQQQPQRWIDLIAKLRGIYRGSMTYAANWGAEFEALSFWSHLDYIGLDCYYPLSESSEPSDAALRQAFAEKLELAKRISQQAKRPLLLTEIGFTSTPAPWRSPHQDGRGKPYNGQTQQRCYKICMQVLAESGDWQQGVLWWKFPSDLSEGGGEHTGFTPNEKPAEEQLARWFSRLP